jgi:hypothetical protein
MFPQGTVVTPDDHVVLPAFPLVRWQVAGRGIHWESQLTGSVTGVQVSIETIDG